MKLIDRFLNTTTIYRLVLYYLIGLIVVAVVFAFFGLIPFSPLPIIFSALFLIFVSWTTNTVFAKIWKVSANVESVYISALILVLIFAPLKTFGDLALLFWTAVLAMASKYILAINKKHLFNPVALAAFVMAFALNFSASWWVGTLPLLPFVLAGGLLIVHKLQRSDLILSFLVTFLATTLIAGVMRGSDLTALLKEGFFYSPLLFFAFVMLTEPLTTPPSKIWQRWYGALVGFLFVPQLHFAYIYLTPEMALLLGNVFSFLVSPKLKLTLTLKEKKQIGPGLYDFTFIPDQKPDFLPGQYLEWTLDHKNPDARGVRRYFTIASSPTENEIRLGMKFYNDSSSFKKALLAMENGQTVSAGQLAGDFVLPKNAKEKLAFIAGGIGITPFRSMIKYMLDKDEFRDVVLFYSAKTAPELIYRDLLKKAADKLNLKVVYTITDLQNLPSNWQDEKGYINEEILKHHLPDFKSRIFYLSGPKSMTDSFKSVLQKMGVLESQIKTDFFPGFV